MTPDQIIIIAQILLKYGPATAQAIVELFRKPSPTAADWDAVFAAARKSYDSYVAPKTP